MEDHLAQKAAETSLRKGLKVKEPRPQTLKAALQYWADNPGFKPTIVTIGHLWCYNHELVNRRFELTIDGQEKLKELNEAQLVAPT